jgi:hypothetical protein
MSLPLVQAKSCKLLTKGLLEEEKSLLAIYNKKTFFSTFARFVQSLSPLSELAI